MVDMAKWGRAMAARRAEGARTTAIISVPCASCGASPYDACRDRTGRVADAHDVRITAAADALAELRKVEAPNTRPRSAAARVDRDVELREHGCSPFRVTVSSRAALAMLEEARRSEGSETGGLLAGILGDGQVLVTHAGDPGPAAVRTRSSFKPDQKHNAALALRLAHESGGAVRQLGGWHVHPSGALEPSHMDVRASAGVMHALAHIDGPLPAFVDVILCPDYLGSWSRPRASGWVMRRDGRRLVCEPVTLGEGD